MRRLRIVTGIALLCVVTLFTTASECAAAIVQGSRGEKVALIQQTLSQWGYYKGGIDGHFGRSTYNAVVAFQKKNGLTVDGKVGSATASAMGITLSSSVSQPLYQETELALLARLVNGEARGEPYTGQVAVAAVVLNRVRSDEFPDTVSGVIFQRGAFDAVWDGQFDLPPEESCIRAAQDALNGWDPSGGCLYYYNPETATNKWIWTRQVQLTIGQHAFAI